MNGGAYIKACILERSDAMDRTFCFRSTAASTPRTKPVSRVFGLAGPLAARADAVARVRGLPVAAAEALLDDVERRALVVAQVEE